ncbi:MAG: glycosyltransferase family 4 protein, partial [Candidatus Rokuibacteriota bacterium]
VRRASRAGSRRVRVDLLSSTPPSAIEGSGTFVGLDGLARGLAALGHHVALRSLRVRTGFHTLDRWLYNAAVAASPPRGDLVIGVDLDGFLWARWRRRRGRPPAFVAAPKGVIADELRNERGWVRVLLSLQARWERANLHGADRVIVTSRYCADVVGTLYGVPPLHLAVVPEPIDLAEWSRWFAQAERRPRTRPTVLTVARMYPRKRLSDLLAAAALLRGRIPALEVRIVGDGPEASSLRVQRQELGLGTTVTLLGDVSRRALAEEYVNADCFCLPSVQEGFGIVFTEAMAAGLPVVACRAAAIPEVVLDGVTGLLVRPRCPADLAQAMELLLMDERLRNDLGEAGLRRVQEFDLAPVARRFLAACGR